MSFLSRIKKAKESAARVTELAPPEVAAKRMEICKECPMLMKLNRCKECGCFMDAKTKLNNVQCPLGKW